MKNTPSPTSSAPATITAITFGSRQLQRRAGASGVVGAGVGSAGSTGIERSIVAWVAVPRSGSGSAARRAEPCPRGGVAAVGGLRDDEPADLGRRAAGRAELLRRRLLGQRVDLADGRAHPAQLGGRDARGRTSGRVLGEHPGDRVPERVGHGEPGDLAGDVPVRDDVPGPGPAKGVRPARSS